MAAALLGVLCTTCKIMIMIMLLAATNTCTSSVEAARPRQFKVGGHLGWLEPVGPDNTAFYNQWAASNRFQIGDSLVFEYQNDSVLAVEKWDYFHCEASDPITAFDNGNSTFNLDRPGAFYFISGTEHHCQNGQKLIVDVMSPHPIPKSPPSISIPPQQGFSPMAPSPSHTHSSGVSVSPSVVLMLNSVLMAHLVTFVIVVLLAP